MGKFKTILFVVAFAGAVFFLGAAYLLFQKKAPTPNSAGAKSNDRGTASLPPPTTAPVSRTQVVDSSQLPPAGGVPNDSSQGSPSEPSQFAKWLKLESQTLSQVGVNSAQKEIQMKNLARTMDTFQKKELVSSALNTGNSANERILATYLLSLTMGQDSSAHLQAVAGAPIPDLGPITPHSAAEVRRVQEFSLRYLLVDELAKRAGQDTLARQQLQNISETAAVREVRQYARRKISEIGSL